MQIQKSMQDVQTMVQQVGDARTWAQSNLAVYQHKDSEAKAAVSRGLTTSRSAWGCACAHSPGAAGRRRSAAGQRAPTQRQPRLQEGSASANAILTLLQVASKRGELEAFRSAALRAALA